VGARHNIVSGTRSREMAVHIIAVALLHEAGMGGATTTRTMPHGATRRHLSMLTPSRVQELVAPFRAHHDSASWECVRQCVITRIPELRWRPAMPEEG